MAIKLKTLTAEEQAAIKKLSRSCTAPAVEVERARIILLASAGARVPAIARKLELTETNVRVCLKRFDDEGLARLQDRPRSGRPVTYQSEQDSEVIVATLTDPQRLGWLFARRTPDRIGVSQEEKKILIKRN